MKTKSPGTHGTDTQTHTHTFLDDGVLSKLELKLAALESEKEVQDIDACALLKFHIKE